MKRFWKQAERVARDTGWGIALDGREVKTPARASLVVPTKALADAIGAEWNGQGHEVEPRTMPLTGLANAAIDHVLLDPAAFATPLARFGQSDLLYYRAEGPKRLVERQAAAWDPLLDWARRRYDVDFATSHSLMHVAQPDATVRRLTQAVHELDPFRLAALSPLVTISGSLIIGLAVVEQAWPAEAAWTAASVEERWQLDEWGSDVEAEAALAGRREAFLAAAAFLDLL